MNLFRELYFRLFGEMADAVDAIESGDAPRARDILVAGMQEAEETVVSSDVEI